MGISASIFDQWGWDQDPKLIGAPATPKVPFLPPPIPPAPLSAATGIPDRGKFSITHHVDYPKLMKNYVHKD